MKTAALLLAALAMIAVSMPAEGAQYDAAGARTGTDGKGDEPRQPERPRRPKPGSGLGPVILYIPPIRIAPPAIEVPPPRKAAPVKRAAKPATRSTQRKVAKAARKPAPAKAAPANGVVGPYAAGEVLFAAASADRVDAILARYRLTRIETTALALTGTALVRARTARGDNVPAVLAALKADRDVALAQANHLYTLTGATGADLAAVQYAPQRIRAAEAHRAAEGASVPVAVIDSGVDGGHAELSGALDPKSAARTVGPHGTAVAGVIAAHARMIGISPGARILSYDAFIGAGGTAQGSTIDILKSLDKAAEAGARIVNMSFAGPPDALLTLSLAAAHARGIVLIAAAGNGGPKAAPLYPAADPSVIAVTATDPADKAYGEASRGAHVAIAAPGVDILSPAPGGSYQQLSGTSLAAAHVSGVAALLVGENPALTPDDIRGILTRTAKDLGRNGRDDIFGAGLVDAAAAVEAVPRQAAAMADGVR